MVCQALWVMVEDRWCLIQQGYQSLSEVYWGYLMMLRFVQAQELVTVYFHLEIYVTPVSK
jgi:hypothetical protein